jgi:chemotaxis protein MotB
VIGHQAEHLDTGMQRDEPPEYWVTYSDLLVSLLVVFALLLFASLARMEVERAAADNARTAVRKTLVASDHAMRTAVSAMGDTSVVGYDARTRTLTVRDEVLFDFGSAALKPRGVEVVHTIATRFLPGLLSDTAVSGHIEAVVVEGHTDTVGTYLWNLDLSQRRAQTVMRALVEMTYGKPYAARTRSLLVASGRSEVDALEAAAAGRYDARRARRIVLRVRLRDAEMLRQLLGDSDSVRLLPPRR